MENLMKTLVSMESELKDVKNNQEKIILRHNALKDITHRLPVLKMLVA